MKIDFKMNDNFDTYEHLKRWKDEVDNQKVEVNSTSIILYKYKYKWMKYLPMFIIKLLVKPIMYNNCELHGIEYVGSEDNNSLSFTMVIDKEN